MLCDTEIMKAVPASEASDIFYKFLEADSTGWQFIQIIAD
jgi:hypothetical protein